MSKELGYAGIVVVGAKLSPIITSEGAQVQLDPRFWQVRPTVANFGALMENVLKMHDDRPGWQDCDPRWLFNRLVEEARELHSSIEHLVLAVPAVAGETQMRLLTQTIARKAANVANFAMMITDVTGGMDPASPLLGSYSSDGLPGLANDQ